MRRQRQVPEIQAVGILNQDPNPTVEVERNTR